MIAALAIEARHMMGLRHVPLYLLCLLAERRELKAEIVEEVICRADEPAELLALWWKDGWRPIPGQIKKGLALALRKFDAYQVAKYATRKGAVRLRDVIRLVHPKPETVEQTQVWERVVRGTIRAPDTWESLLSAGHDKLKTWTYLLEERKLGTLALLRNLRHFEEAGVSSELVTAALAEANLRGILPHQFIAAASHAPEYRDELEILMARVLDGEDRWPGDTVIAVDCSGSMGNRLSSHGTLTRLDAAAGVAIHLQGVCERVRVFAVAILSKEIKDVIGFQLRDVFDTAWYEIGSGTRLGSCLNAIREKVPKYDRLVLITDEQSSDPIPDPWRRRGYIVNVASAKNGIGYGSWVHIDGWSANVVRYIREAETMDDLVDVTKQLPGATGSG
jgi:hypothetical protein